jgi:hypothetical protein
MNTLGGIQPLPIFPIVWIDIPIDFIEGLPKSSNKSVIVVVVDRLLKYGLHRPFKASMVTQVFMDQIFKLHGMAQYIVMDHDPIFTGNNCLGCRAINCILASLIILVLLVRLNLSTSV